MNPKSITASRSEIAREIIARGGTIVMHLHGREMVHQPPGSRNNLENYSRIRRLSEAYYAAPVDDDWAVAILDRGEWRICTPGLSKDTAILYAETMTACDCPSIAVRRLQ